MADWTASDYHGFGRVSGVLARAAKREIRHSQRSGHTVQAGRRGARVSTDARKKRPTADGVWRGCGDLPGRLHQCERQPRSSRSYPLRARSPGPNAARTSLSGSSKRVKSRMCRNESPKTRRARCCSAWCRAAGKWNCGKPAPRALLDIGFDGYGYGGWPLDRTAACLPTCCKPRGKPFPLQFPMHALGIGSPESVVRCAQMGYGIFDCALPTRDARNGRLYVWKTDPAQMDFTSTSLIKNEWLDTLYIDDEKHTKVDKPISTLLRLPHLRPLRRRLSAASAQSRRNPLFPPRHPAQPALYDAVSARD